ncbi:MAG TPA: glucose-1-phosphate adenylyltransferase, partial [Spongiibacteraceae bacterium]|nr:glucose-1-phosphate adenylyltransferase [Spongiibacteraceae bacterium]
LTDWRAKPAVPFGGQFRIIDFSLSNCVNSGIRRIGVLTQYKAHSLIHHVQRGWGFLRGELGEFVELLPAQQRTDGSWYQGTADAILQNIDIIRNHNPTYILVLAGDHVYKMDYGPMLAAHVSSGADVTVGCIEVAAEEACAYGVMKVDADNRILEFMEKPARAESIPGKPGVVLASMGIYVFNTETLCAELIRDGSDKDSNHDFGRNIIPTLIGRNNSLAFPFRDPKQDKQAYWRDVGTVDALWQANLELIGVSPELNLYDKDWPIWTYPEQLPPAKFVFDEEARRGVAIDSMVAGGCIVSGALIRHSLLFSNVHVHSFTEVIDSVVLPDVDIGRHVKIRNAIIDRGCQIPNGMEIGVDEKIDRARFEVTERGVVLVTPEMLGQRLHYSLDAS